MSEEKSYSGISSRNAEFYHHGVQGQKWGVQNGPPYPLDSAVSTGKRLLKSVDKKIAEARISRAEKKGKIEKVGRIAAKHLSTEEIMERTIKKQKQIEYENAMNELKKMTIQSKIDIAELKNIKRATENQKKMEKQAMKREQEAYKREKEQYKREEQAYKQQKKESNAQNQQQKQQNQQEQKKQSSGSGIGEELKKTLIRSGTQAIGEVTKDAAKYAIKPVIGALGAKAQEKTSNISWVKDTDWRAATKEKEKEKKD